MAAIVHLTKGFIHTYKEAKGFSVTDHGDVFIVFENVMKVPDPDADSKTATKEVKTPVALAAIAAGKWERIYMDDCPEPEVDEGKE